MQKLIVLAAILASPAVSSAFGIEADSSQDEFVLAVIQMQIHQDLFGSSADFSKYISSFVEQAAEEGATLIVLPEYLNVFLATKPYHDSVRQSDSLSEAAARVFARPDNPQSLRELFIRESHMVRSLMDDLYGQLALAHNVYILAGTYFAAEKNYRSPDGFRLTNRSLLYGPEGNTVHEQDKVYLTPFEELLIGLDHGYLSEIEGVTVEDYDIGITICRDTFFPVWEYIHAERDLWIDLRAEGTEWTQGREDFTELMPERLEGSGTSFGATSSLTGEFLDLFWEGKSSISTSLPESAVILEMAENYYDSDILILSLDGIRSTYDETL
ncbi:hypothetical protein JCM12856_16060 [Spirochaeta dissipatitropha]